MAEYIDRGHLETVLTNYYNRLAGLRPDFYAGFSAAMKVIDDETINADVAPVIHAHVVVNWLGDCHCSNCGDYCDSSKQFCASCGARFDEPEMRED